MAEQAWYSEQNPEWEEEFTLENFREYLKTVIKPFPEKIDVLWEYKGEIMVAIHPQGKEDICFDTLHIDAFQIEGWKGVEEVFVNKKSVKSMVNFFLEDD